MVAQAERHVTGEGLVEGLLQVAAPLGPGREGPGLGRQLGVAAGPPGDEVGGVLRQGAHALRRDVEQVLEVDGAERRPQARVGGGVDQHDVERGAASAGDASRGGAR